MAVCLGTCKTLVSAALLASVLMPTAGDAQQIVPSSNGFTIGTSSGRTTFYRQVAKSEANTLLQVISTNASTDPGTADYRITNPLEAFSVVNERHAQSAGDSTTSIGGASFSGFNFSVFSQ
jgi:hypothetical protein